MDHLIENPEDLRVQFHSQSIKLQRCVLSLSEEGLACEVEGENTRQV